MALVQYNKLYWYPNGAIAANVPAAVFLHEVNAFAPLFADQAGTIPLPNPLNTSPTGYLTFYAEEGPYWVHLDTEAFDINVGLTEEQADLTTGIAAGGEMNIAGPQSVEIKALVGYVADVNELTSVEPTPIKVDRPTQVVPLDAGALARSVTYWVMDNAGVVTQQAVPATPIQRRTHLALGISFYDTNLATLVEVQTQPVILGQPGNQMADFMDAVGPLKLSGNLISPNGVNLSFNKDSGVLFVRGSNHFASGVLTDNPHETTSPAQAPATLRRILRTASITTPPAVTTIDPTNYDVGGVLTPVGGGTNTSTIQRVWVFPTGVSSAQIAVQYGQSTYSSLTAAVAAVGKATFVRAPITSFAALAGYIVVARTATNLSDPAQAVFIQAGKFATP